MAVPPGAIPSSVRWSLDAARYGPAMFRRLGACALLIFAAAGALAQATPDASLDALLAARPREDTEQLRRQLLQGDMPTFSADLRLRAGVAGARRFALVETCSPGDPVVTLLVDDGEFARVYRRSAGWHTSMGYDNAKLVREAPRRSFDTLWRVLQAHAGAPAAAAAEAPAPPSSGAKGDAKAFVGFVTLHDARGERSFLLTPGDFTTTRHTGPIEDLIGHTLLAGLHYHGGEEDVPAWFGEWVDGLRELPHSAREERDDAMWSAIRHADWAGAKALVEAGADPNAFASDGESLAHWLFRSKDPAAAEHLALLRADPAEANFFGEAPTPTGR